MKASSEKKITLDGVSITLTRKRVKNINLRISQKSGDVIVSAPKSVPEGYILSFLQSKIDWISERQTAAKEQTSQKQPTFINGESHRFLGDDYSLEVISSIQRPKCIIKNDPTLDVPFRLQLFCSNQSSTGDKETLLSNWYRQELKRILPAIVKKWSEKLDVSINEYRIKKMKTKWGTCNIQDRRIWLNLELIKYPVECIEYVVLHELTHLFERYHNARFYSIVEHNMPDWQKWERLLDHS